MATLGLFFSSQNFCNVHLSLIKALCHFNATQGPPLTPLWTLRAPVLHPLTLQSSPTFCFLCKGLETGEYWAYLSNSKEAPGFGGLSEGREVGPEPAWPQV